MNGSSHFCYRAGQGRKAWEAPQLWLQTLKVDFRAVRICRKELDKLLPEEFRRFDVRDRSYVRSQSGSALRARTAQPPPKRSTMVEAPVDHRADPVTGYAKLGYAGLVRIRICQNQL